jgi:hypothetical protein
MLESMCADDVPTYGRKYVRVFSRDAVSEVSYQLIKNREYKLHGLH